MKRFDRDNYDLQRSGKSWNAGTLLAGVNMLAQTLPSNVWQNLVGVVEGFIEHTPEALENLGLLGAQPQERRSVPRSSLAQVPWSGRRRRHPRVRC